MKSILLIQLKRIGDLILTVPALAAIRQTWPEASLSLVIDGESAGLAPAIDGVDRILVYQKNSLNLRTFRRVIFGRYDAALDFTGTDRSSLLTGLSKADRRVTFLESKRNLIRSQVYNRFIDSPVRDRHTIDHHLDLLAGIDLAPGPQPLELRLPQSAHAKVRDLLSTRSIREPFVVFHIGAARAEKYWTAQRWAAVFDYCAGTLGRPCVIIGGHSEMEKMAVAEVRQHATSDFVDLTGHLNLMASAALISRASLFVGIDSGPSHLAAAAQVPQVTLYGPTNPFHWRARHEQSVVLQGGKANPLAVFDSHASPGELIALSTEEVIHAINQLLSSP